MGRVNLIIDGESIKVRDDTTILEVATAHGITICTLCHIEGLIPAGVCRVCMEETEGSMSLPFPC